MLHLARLLLTAMAIVPAVAAAQMPAVPVAGVESGELEPRIHKAHAIAMHGTPKYGPDDRRFDYLNADAPKGGRLRLASSGTYDSFNPYLAKGTPAAGAGYLYDTLMGSSADEPFTEYGLIAETVEWPEDRSWIIFNLNPEARWHDGEPITADDVIFSLETLKTKGHPFYRFYYKSIVEARKLGPRRVKFIFEGGEVNRELPLIAGQLPVLPKHYWEDREFDRTTLEPPLGSGPYRIADFEAGRYVVYERVDDYWAKDLPLNKGRYNFDRVRYEFFRDDTVIREAVKSGLIDAREENQAKAWALDYDVPQVREGWLKKEEIAHERPTGMQAFVMNTRREVFQDPKVRRALAYAFDFEWTNRNLFFGQYSRTESFFSNSDLAARGLPSEAELEILEPLRGQIPEEVFTKAYTAPATDGSGWPRQNLERAFELLEEAGWVVRDMRLVDAETGEPMRFEILLNSPAFERIVLPFKRNLDRLGIDVFVRLVDPAQYVNRVRGFDFDMIVGSWGQSESPGNEQRDFWGSQAAETQGSRNYAGIQDPAIDKLIDLVIAAPDRQSLITRVRALDRVLLWQHFVIPQWHLSADRILSWNKFSRPEVTPDQGTSFNYWWLDEAKAAALESRSTEISEMSEASESGGMSDLAYYLLIGILMLAAVVGLRRLRHA